MPTKKNRTDKPMTATEKWAKKKKKDAKAGEKTIVGKYQKKLKDTDKYY